ncbi:MAG TPA: hypothetical protein VEC14_02065, partial [Reyranellaceae bacterium]|nr:hypothetical protein [Reyranellaceae bacterium]
MSAIFPITADSRFRRYVATAGQTAFSVPFPFQNDADIKLIKIATNGTRTELVNPTHYTLTGAGNPAGGTATLVSGAALNDIVIVAGAAIMDRTLSIVRNGAFQSKAIDDDIDRALIRDAELARDAARALKLEFGAAVPAAGDFPKWDANGLIVSGGSAADIANAQSNAAIAAAAALSVSQTVAALPTVIVTAPVGANINTLLAAVPDNRNVIIAPGSYTFSGAPINPADYWTEDGEASLDTPFTACIGLRNRRNLIINAYGCTFTPDVAAEGYVVYWYKSAHCKWLGGTFVGNATFQAGAKQATAVLTARCWDVEVADVKVDKFYRNLFGIRSDFSAFRRSQSTNGGYFNAYGSGFRDVALTVNGEYIPPVTGERVGGWLFEDLFVAGGKYGNCYGNGADYVRIQSFNAGRQGVAAAHFIGQTSFLNVRDSLIVETSD